jgi:predicted DNA repair protein MutK
MSAGLFGLLDDVAVLARLAAASGRASVKAAGVVIDDTAVTPQYVHGIAAERELPIIKRIAIGSLRNKLLVILPVAMLLSQFAPRLLIPTLMLGAIYLCYEGAEKIWGSIRRSQGHDSDTPPVGEDEVVTGAVRTDLVLSAEIMMIALNEVADQAFLARLIILIVVALVLTAGVYGVVAVIVKMDDVGLRLTQTASRIFQYVGRGLVTAMPALLSALAAVGTVAMLWVGGHILLAGSDHLGWHPFYRVVHHAADQVRHSVKAFGAVLAWLVDTGASAVVGLVVGAVAVALAALLSTIRRGLSGLANRARTEKM